MKVLYIGGTGEISYECVKASVVAGHAVTVFNRGRESNPLPERVVRITGDLANEREYSSLVDQRFDVVCQFVGFAPDEAERDIRVFGGRCGQYVFISTASAYQKPPTSWRITEDTPLENPYWSYSRLKARMETMLMAAHGRGELPVTIVRPSLTYRRRFPGTFVSGDDHAWRMLQGRPVIVHGDGQALWTYTHSRDFAALFVPLLGSARALGEAFHVMTDTVFTWKQLFQGMAATLGVEPNLVHVPTQTLVRYNPEWSGPMLGDKAWSTLFDTSKVRAISGAIESPVSLADGFAGVLPYFRARMEKFAPDRTLHDLLDRIAGEQEALAASR